MFHFYGDEFANFIVIHIGVTIILYIHNMASKLCDVQMVALKPFVSFDSIVATIFYSTHM